MDRVNKGIRSCYDRSMSAKVPSLVFADQKGDIIEFPEMEMVGASAGRFERVAEQHGPAVGGQCRHRGVPLPVDLTGYLKNVWT